MHILYLHQHFVGRSGTSGGRSHEFSRLLVERGHRVTLVTGDFEHSGLRVSGHRLVSMQDVDGIEVRVIRVPYGQALSKTKRILSFLKFMVMACWVGMRVPGIDVVFATSTPLTIAVPGMFVAGVRRRPFVFEVRDLWPEIPIDLGVLRNPVLKWLARGLEKVAYRRASHVIALSPGMKDGVIAAGTPETKVTVIPNSSDVELLRVSESRGQAFRAENPAIGDRPLVVYAGAFGRVNGLEYLIELARHAREERPDVAFLLVGTGSERERLMELARRTGGLERNVFFLPPAPRSGLARILSAATMLSSFVINRKSLRANSANKFFDAFAAARPIAVNYLGWHAELLERTGAGIVLAPDDPRTGARQLLAVLGDSAWLERAATASARLGTEEFNRALLVDRFEDVLRAAASQGRATTRRNHG